MSLLAGIVVVGFGIFLIGLAGVVFVKPALAERFFKSFASSVRAHYIEQSFRLLIGASIVVFSPAMWQADLFEWAIPLVLRHMRLYAVGLFAFGAFLLYGVLYAGPQCPA